MVSAISAFSSMYSAANRIDAGNKVLSNNDAISRNVGMASRGSISFAAAQQREKDLMLSNLQNSMLYRIASAQENAQKEKEKKKLDYMA